MDLIISTSINNISPDFENGQMVLGSATVVVNFQSTNNYFGGQVVLTKQEDGITFTNTQEELQSLAIDKAKKLIANSLLNGESAKTSETLEN